MLLRCGWTGLRLIPRPLLPLGLGLGLLLALIRFLLNCLGLDWLGACVGLSGLRHLVREAELLVVLERELLVVGKRGRIALLLDIIDVDEALLVSVVCPRLALAALLRRRLIGIFADLRRRGRGSALTRGKHM